MIISLSPAVMYGLLVLVTVFIFYCNWGTLRMLTSIKSRVIFSTVIIAEMLILFASRFVVPQLLLIRFIDKSSSLFDIVDTVVFAVLLFITLKVGGRIQSRLN